MKKNIIFILFLICSIQSCIPSLHPLYTEKDLIFIEDLLGTWDDKDSPSEGGNKLEVSSDDGGIWRFEKAGEKKYSLIQIDEEGNKGHFEVRIMKLGKNYFMDFFPKPMENATTQNDFWNYHKVPVHTFAKIDLFEKHVTIKMFNSDFLEELIKKKQIRIKHEKIGDSFLVTASPEELQKFVTKYADEEKVFETQVFVDETTLTRRF